MVIYSKISHHKQKAMYSRWNQISIISVAYIQAFLTKNMNKDSSAENHLLVKSNSWTTCPIFHWWIYRWVVKSMISHDLESYCVIFSNFEFFYRAIRSIARIRINQQSTILNILSIASLWEFGQNFQNSESV